MKLGILQPYLFPYIGYFQLIGAVDTLVIYDDAQWMKGGWINRNRYLVEGQPRYFTLPVALGAVTDAIMQRQFVPGLDHHTQRILRQLAHGYSRAPRYAAVRALVERCFSSGETNVARFLVNALRECCDFLEIRTPFVLSSDLGIDPALRGEARVLEINRAMGSSHYLNPIGGMGLYERARFEAKGLKLNFLRPRLTSYPQFGGEFVPALSILDVMMFNSPADLSRQLGEFDLE